MHPKDEVKSKRGKYFDWEADYKKYKGHNSDAHVFLKKQTRRFIRRSAKSHIKEELDA